MTVVAFLFIFRGMRITLPKISQKCLCILHKYIPDNRIVFPVILEEGKHLFSNSFEGELTYNVPDEVFKCTSVALAMTCDH